MLIYSIILLTSLAIAAMILNGVPFLDPQKSTLKQLLYSLRTNKWHIDEHSACFPLEGRAKSIYIRVTDEAIEYHIPAVSSKWYKSADYYALAIQREINRQYQAQVANIVFKQLCPNTEFLLK